VYVEKNSKSVNFLSSFGQEGSLSDSRVHRCDVLLRDNELARDMAHSR